MNVEIREQVVVVLTSFVIEKLLLGELLLPLRSFPYFESVGGYGKVIEHGGGVRDGGGLRSGFSWRNVV